MKKWNNETVFFLLRMKTSLQIQRIMAYNKSLHPPSLLLSNKTNSR